MFDIMIPRREWPWRPHRSPWRVWILAVVAILLLTPPLLVLALRWLPPPTSAFMLQSEVKPVAYRWVPAAQMSAAIRKTVIAAEDQKFWNHFGFDFEAIGKALEHNERSKRKRGASTISQQVAKNLFLWPGRSWLRKGVETTFTVLLELIWPKERILEVYLNIAEFGPGVYGVEAAAQKFFGKRAARLTAPEAAYLAAVLPNPQRWRADRPGPYVQSRAAAILRLAGYGAPPTAEDAELAEPPAELLMDELEAPPAPAEPAEPGTSTEPVEEQGPIETTPQEMDPDFAPEEAEPPPPSEDVNPPAPSPEALPDQEARRRGPRSV